jgi:hypothetical protein
MIYGFFIQEFNATFIIKFNGFKLRKINELSSNQLLTLFSVKGYIFDRDDPVLKI